MAKTNSAEKNKPAKKAAAGKTAAKSAAKKVAAKAAKPAVKKPAEKKVAEKKAISKKPVANKTIKSAKKLAASPESAPQSGLSEPEVKTQILKSQTVFTGKVFRVQRETIIEPGGHTNTRDIVRHSSSAVILALDKSKSKRDPWVVVERQYRHAANRFLWELPAGKLEAGEEPEAGAARELEEETGYRAKKWSLLTEYFASPGFLSETMKVYVAQGLIPGAAHPEDDEKIEIRLVKFSELLKMVLGGGIIDGKTIIAVLLYARKLAGKRDK